MAAWAPPGPPTSDQQVVQPLAGRAKWARIAVLSNLAATVVGMVATFNERRVLIDIRDGELVSIERADASDNFVLWTSIAFLASFLFAIVMFLRWFFRAYKNLATWRHVEHRTGWAIGAWFVPFLNLFRPFKIAEEIALSSPDPVKYETPWVLRLWWGALLLSNGIDRALFRQRNPTVDSLITRDAVSLLSDAIWIVAGVAVLRIIADATQGQEGRMSSVPSLIS